MPYWVSPRRRRQHQAGGVGRGVARGNGDLAARNGQGLQHQARGRLPQPIADLIVEGRFFSGRADMGVIAQAVEKLRAVELIIDGLQLDPLGKFLALGPVGLGIEIDALGAFPGARQTAQRTQIGQRVGIGVFRFGENVVGNIGHGLKSCAELCRHQSMAGAGRERPGIDAVPGAGYFGLAEICGAP